MQENSIILSQLLAHNDYEKALQIFEEVKKSRNGELVDQLFGSLRKAMISKKCPLTNFLLFFNYLEESNYFKLLSSTKFKDLYEEYGFLLTQHMMASLQNFEQDVTIIAEKMGDENLIIYWASALTADLYPDLMNAFSQSSQLIQQRFLYPLLERSFEQRNFELIENINANFPLTYQQFFNLNGEKYHENISVLNKLQEINQIKDEQYRKFVRHLIAQFISGFSYRENEGGVLKYDGGALTLAATKASKHHICPTILQESQEFAQYLQLILTAETPLRERFVMCAEHWLAGEIAINEQGEINILIIDPTGDQNLLLAPPKTKKPYQLTAEMVKLIDVYFPKENYLIRSIILTAEQKQYANTGCFIFAMDDVFHLYSVEKYLNKKTYPAGLYQYLNKNELGSAVINNVPISISALPLPMLCTMQSRQLFSLFKNSPEQDFKLNKKGDTVRFIAQTEQGFTNRTTYQGTKLQNLRIDDKAFKMFKRNLTYLLENNFETVKEQIASCTLAGFKERILLNHDSSALNYR